MGPSWMVGSIGRSALITPCSKRSRVGRSALVAGLTMSGMARRYGFPPVVGRLVAGSLVFEQFFHPRDEDLFFAAGNFDGFFVAEDDRAALAPDILTDVLQVDEEGFVNAAKAIV